jgi:hypothetical protein
MGAEREGGSEGGKEGALCKRVEVDYSCTQILSTFSPKPNTLNATLEP